MNASFTRMDESTQDDWMTIASASVTYDRQVVDRLFGMLQALGAIDGGFGVTQLDHALQMATMARRDGASDELVVAALFHDVGKAVSMVNHPAIAAEILRPWVSDATYHIVRTHQDFQGRHYYHHFGGSRELREQYSDEPWFADAERFTDVWDQAAFDPEYDRMSLEDFRPMCERVFFGEAADGVSRAEVAGG